MGTRRRGHHRGCYLINSKDMLIQLTMRMHRPINPTGGIPVIMAIVLMPGQRRDQSRIATDSL